MSINNKYEATITLKEQEIKDLKAEHEQQMNEYNAKFAEMQKEIEDLKAKLTRKKDHIKDNLKSNQALNSINKNLSVRNRTLANENKRLSDDKLAHERTIAALQRENEYLKQEITPVEEVVRYVEKPVLVNASSAKQSIETLMNTLGENYRGEDVFRLKNHQLVLNAKNSSEFSLSDEYSRPLYTVVNSIPKDFKQIRTFTTLKNAINQLSGNGYLLIYKLKNNSTVLMKENSNMVTLSENTMKNDDAKVYAIINLKAF